MNNWWVYIVEKKTGLYVVMTTDLENRMKQHGQTAPLYYEGPISKADALKRERTLKSWSLLQKPPHNRGELIRPRFSSREKFPSRGILPGEPFRQGVTAALLWTIQIHMK
jgi:predicted GIY-YIG superfamily endonuclease